MGGKNRKQKMTGFKKKLGPTMEFAERGTKRWNQLKEAELF